MTTPSNPDAERALLSCFLKSPSRIGAKAVDQLTQDHFFTPAHKLLFTVLAELWHESPEFDLVGLNTRLQSRGLMEQVGGPSAVADLLDDVPSLAFFDHYVKQVTDKLILRRIIQEAEAAIERATEAENPEAALDATEEAILAIRGQAERNEAGPVPATKWAVEGISLIQEWAQGRGKGLSTGFENVDDHINGLESGRMYVVAARPGDGKTAIMAQICSRVAEQGAPVLVFSAEMTKAQMAVRFFSQKFSVDSQSMRQGILSRVELQRMMAGITQFQDITLDIDDTPGITIGQIRARSRRYRHDHGGMIGLIAVDYLQLIRSADRRGRENRQVEVADISAGLKALSKELDCPVLVLAQLNRDKEKSNRPPRKSDLRESGAIEQDADVIALLHKKATEDDPMALRVWSDVDLILDKVRDGKPGTVQMEFHGPTTTFREK